ncbi:hypothetical protein GLOTRDRAFT_113478 [Gloeophyllum trabeum ATCC 11539]|uniref:C2H2-type domain-containing protein n=1 Tax=Gloeophyllum trabeum (strain ATCC 11539 / FP-39264 / Madison 617) TaxID=670483 RepID=S7S0W1_GLOTA|nr:uncharacterized protein GLOTRDRAFT_113478 [Gloeophyllum trabeum ATCC 11539]EPQ60990.1 hypothetical protein GLOTRDRAFT_113478 [Gloeophyllum trabeum ATCC 11539]
MESDPFASFYPPALDVESFGKNNKSSTPAVADYKQQQAFAGFDLFSFQSPSDLLAPHPDLFESELDRSLEACSDQFQLQLLTVDSNDAFSFLRSDTPIYNGPPSTITVSSESAYESLSSRSESFYNYPSSPNYAPSNLSFPLDLDMDFRRISVGHNQIDDYAAVANVAQQQSSGYAADPTSYGSMQLAPAPNNSSGAAPPSAFERAVSYDRRASLSDYEPSGGVHNSGFSSSSSDYYPQYKYSPRPRADSTSASSTNVSPKMPAMPSVPVIPPLGRAQKEEYEDPRKKYPCPTCHRSFARAYNLKTHIATHDPNRPKPHICPHRSCGRSFSRKHDLGRHLVSIHRDESACPTQTRKPIGVEKASRGWCDNCGRGYIGRDRSCDCNDVK